jgi:phosphoribosyl 1,2-cyclic phosphodiesterase
MTDTGYVHVQLKEYMENCECYVLESNHDPDMLMASSRPYQLKLRILSDHGHLSNEDSMVALANLMGEKTKLVMHAHVSEECNLSPIIEMTRKKIFDSYNINRDDITYVILSRRPSGEYNI